jgi:60 kDa SS-A/Ro ribonucleoprotein
MKRKSLPELIIGFEEMKAATKPAEAVKLIEKYGLPRETVPTELLLSIEVWDALLRSGKGMPFTAMVRNLGKMSSIGLLAPMSEASKFVRDRLKDKDGLKKARVHPIQLLLAQSVYGAGHGVKGKLSWNVDQKIVDALDDAFHGAFSWVEPTGKRVMLALDISGSMSCGNVAGTPLTPREAASAMAMVTARTEEEHFFVGFTSSGHGYGQSSWGLTDLTISPKMRLKEVCQYTAALPMGGTDCALPILYALKRKMPFDVFQVYTDNESWAGSIHPVQALQKYRAEMGIPAKLVAVGITATEYSIADPNDAGMMDVVGFDTSVPQIIHQFIKS